LTGNSTGGSRSLLPPGKSVRAKEFFTPELNNNSVYLSYTPIKGFGYDIYGSFDITMFSAMLSLAIGCLLVS
jgi:hypothetical protein